MEIKEFVGCEALNMTWDYLTKRQAMTYILGSKCKNGVILVGDRKVTYGDGSPPKYDNKIFLEAGTIVWGASGVQAFFDSFTNRVREKVAQMKRTISFGEFRIIVEETYEDMARIYGEMFRSQGLSALIAQRPVNESELWLIEGIGAPQRVSEYQAIGHGRPYGSIFLKKLWQPQLTMEQVAELGYFIIKYLEDSKLDTSVGVGDKRPQIWFIPNNVPNEAPEIHEGDTALLDRLEINYQKRLKAFQNSIEDIFKL